MMNMRIAAVVCLAVAAQVFVDAQGRGGGRGNAPATPTQQQWDGSAETQRRVAAAMKLAGTDLLPQAKMFMIECGRARLAALGQS